MRRRRRPLSPSTPLAQSHHPAKSVGACAMISRCEVDDALGQKCSAIQCKSLSQIRGPYRSGNRISIYSASHSENRSNSHIDLRSEFRGAAMKESFELRLKRAAEELASQKREQSLRQGVGSFVRLNRDLLLTLHSELGTWSNVAELLSGEGLRWKTGRPVTGSQLRSLLSRTRTRLNKTTSQPRADNLVSGPLPSKPLIQNMRPRPQDSPQQKPIRGLSDLLDT